MELKVFTMKTCPNCPAAKKIVQEVAQKYDIGFVEVDIGTSEGQIAGLMYQVMSTPSIAIGEDVISRGKLVSREKLEEEVKKRLEK